jgi:hypothetical protein
MGAPFQPGDVVVCVDDRLGTHGKCFSGEWVSKGAHYRITVVYQNQGVKLAGFQLDGREWFSVRRFRKIDDEVTEEFREQLAKLPVRERVS